MEEEKRDIKKLQHKQLIMDIGKTKYTLNLHFKQGSGETYKDKILNKEDKFPKDMSSTDTRIGNFSSYFFRWCLINGLFFCLPFSFMDLFLL